MLLDIEGAGVFSVMSRRTIEADVYLTNLLRAAGTGEAITDEKAGEDIDARIFHAVTNSGKLFDILGAALVPEGVDSLDWTPALAKETAQKLRRVTSEKAKRTLLLSVVPLVTGFFLLGLHSSATSRKSSPAKASAVQPASANAATTTMETGVSWSARLRTTIRAARRRFSDGR